MPNCWHKLLNLVNIWSFYWLMEFNMRLWPGRHSCDAMTTGVDNGQWDDGFFRGDLSMPKDNDMTKMSFKGHDPERFFQSRFEFHQRWWLFDDLSCPFPFPISFSCVTCLTEAFSSPKAASTTITVSHWNNRIAHTRHHIKQHTDIWSIIDRPLAHHAPGKPFFTFIIFSFFKNHFERKILSIFVFTSFFDGLFRFLWILLFSYSAPAAFVIRLFGFYERLFSLKLTHYTVAFASVVIGSASMEIGRIFEPIGISDLVATVEAENPE